MVLLRLSCAEINLAKDLTKFVTCDKMVAMETTTCTECQRVFDLNDENDNAEWHYGHDCEG